MAEYFCYISQSKVDNLLEQIEEKEYITTSRTEEEIIEKQKAANPTLGRIFGLFSIGVTFGKKDRIVVSEVKHSSIIQKLKRVVSHLTSTHGLPDLRAQVQSRRLDSVYYSFEGAFKVKKYDSNFAHLESHLPPQITLELICSMKYFSDMGQEDDRFVPHSGNWAFFYGKITPTFKTVIVVQDFKKDRIVGSPLFLALQPIGELNL